MNENLAEMLADMSDYPVQLGQHALEKMNIKLHDAGRSESVLAFVPFETPLKGVLRRSV